MVSRGTCAASGIGSQPGRSFLSPSVPASTTCSWQGINLERVVSFICSPACKPTMLPAAIPKM